MINWIARLMASTPCSHSRIATFAVILPCAIPLLLSLICSCVLIERKWGLFSESFLTTSPLKLAHIPLFLAFAFLIDLTFLYALLILWTFCGRLVRLSYKTISLSFIIAGSTVVCVINIAHYNVIAYLGDVTRINTALNVGGGMVGALPYILSALPSVLFYGVAIPLGGTAGFVVLRRMTHHMPNVPTVRFINRLKIFAGLVFCWICVEVYMTLVPASHPVVANLRRTCVYLIEHPVARTLTDFDGDGFGLLDNPPDFAPFDSHRHPFALEIPGNGVDANGIGGDLPRYEPPEEEYKLGSVFSQPDIVLIMACTLRYDVVFGGDIGSSAMPKLLELSRQGFSTNRAYSHTGFTTSSMQATLCGRLASPHRSLIQDFKAAKYQVGVFSTHDDSFGDSRRVCVLDQSDRYFDASMDRNARVTPSAAPSSILLSGKRIIKEATGFLESSKVDQPMFLFAFFATTHYPYTHDSPRNIIPHERLSPSEIRPGSREQIISLYRNAAANLDEQLADLLEQVRRHRKRPDPVIIILGDHGESLFDDGMLGHGLKINEVQTRVPLIIVNGWGTVPVPFGQTDLRGFLFQMLSSPRPKRPVVTARLAERKVFQYTGTLPRPQEIGVVSPNGRTVVNLEDRVVQTQHGKTRPLTDISADALSLELIHRWECFSLLSQSRVAEPEPSNLPSNKDELELLGREWCKSNSWFRREKGIKILRDFNNEVNIEILKNLVRDTVLSTSEEYRLNAQSQSMAWNYCQTAFGVQQLAHDTLQLFGVQVDPPQPQEQSEWRNDVKDLTATSIPADGGPMGGQMADWVGSGILVFALAALLYYWKRHTYHCFANRV